MIWNLFINMYFLIHNIEILGINWKLWYYKNDKYDTLYDFLDMYISAMHRIFIQAGEIISDAHALNRPFKPIHC